MNNISVIDCTLRDGGYLNNWNFNNEFRQNILQALVESNIDIIECGFVSEKNGSDLNGTNFKSLNKVNEILLKNNFKENSSKFAVMLKLNEFDINNLADCNHSKNQISIIRVMVYQNEIEKSIGKIRKIIEKGYEVHIQPTIISHYSDTEIIQMLTMFNQLNYGSIAIVDTFGALNPVKIKNITKIFDTYAKSSAALTIHCHNNLSLPYENTLSFVESINKDRKTFIDSSLLGLGRGCGNLPTEKIIQWLNIEKNKNYKYKLIHNFCLTQFNNFDRSISEKDYYAYSITAKRNIHPNYATKLILSGYKKEHIEKILSKITEDNSQTFNEEKLQNICKQL